MTIRSPWGKLWKKRGVGVDYTVSPVHDIEDDVDEDDDDGGTDPPPTLEPLVTGITDEYPDSELIFDEDGDIVTDG